MEATSADEAGWEYEYDAEAVEVEPVQQYTRAIMLTLLRLFM